MSTRIRDRLVAQYGEALVDYVAPSKRKSLRMPTKGWAVCRTQRECFGHGDFGDVTHIIEGQPIFTDKSEAEKHLKKPAFKWCDYSLTEVEIR